MEIERCLRLAGERLWPGHVPVKPEHTEAIKNVINRVGLLRLPGSIRDSALAKVIDTEHGPLRMVITPLNEGMRDRGGALVKSQMDYGLRQSQLITQNPHALDTLHHLGNSVRGIGSVFIHWPNEPGAQIDAPQSIRDLPQRDQIRATMQISRKLNDLYHNFMIPEIQRHNPGKSILLSNEPATMSRERLYRRNGMGRVDPIGMQYSLVGPQRGARPEKFELFGGHLPGLFLDEISNKNTFPN